MQYKLHCIKMSAKCHHSKSKLKMKVEKSIKSCNYCVSWVISKYLCAVSAWEEEKSWHNPGLFFLPPSLSHLSIFFLLIYKLLKSAINPTSKAEKGISTRHSKGGPSDYNNPILLQVSLRGFSPCAECRNVIPLWACAPQTCNQHTPAASLLGSLLLSYGTKTQKNNNFNKVAGAVIAVPTHSGIKMPGSSDPHRPSLKSMHPSPWQLQHSMHTKSQITSILTSHLTPRMLFNMKLWRLGGQDCIHGGGFKSCVRLSLDDEMLL